jgi:hypothetical protein
LPCLPEGRQWFAWCFLLTFPYFPFVRLNLVDEWTAHPWGPIEILNGTSTEHPWKKRFHQWKIPGFYPRF